MKDNINNVVTSQMPRTAQSWMKMKVNGAVVPLLQKIYKKNL